MLEVIFTGLAQFNPQTSFQPASGGAPEALYFTHNGGASWDGPVILNGMKFPDFIDDQHGWALNGTGSALLTTSDGGRNWATLPTDPNFSEASLPDFVSSQVGWAFKYNDQDGTELLIKTVDGGRTWTQLNVPVIPN
jgi:photosystem II stability/assembly factor-like uncharacterized protein